MLKRDLREVFLAGRWDLYEEKFLFGNELVVIFLQKKFCRMEKSLYFCTRF